MKTGLLKTEEIQNELSSIKVQNNIKILHAVEAGSRAWEFESVDSDYDIRFIYMRDLDWYLSLEEDKDNIEFMGGMNGDLDFVGWDLRKAMRLFRKSNPVLLEWLISPQRYEIRGTFRTDLLKLAEKYYSFKTMSYHYYSMAYKEATHLFARTQIQRKKYFYILRPLLVIKWLKQQHSFPPLSFINLYQSFLDMPKTVKIEIENLINAKKIGKEEDLNTHIDTLDRYIEQLFEETKQYRESIKHLSMPLKEVNELFIKTLKS